MKMFTEEMQNKKGVVKRSLGFVKGTERAKTFKSMQNTYFFTKYDAKNILSDNQKKLGLNQSETCVLNTLIKFSSMASWEKALPICTATNARIGEASGYKKGTVSNVLRTLEDKGFILRNSYNKYNQRVGDEPISLAPFGAMLPDWIDEELVQWKLNKRENITGRKQTAQEIMITHDDKKSFYKEKDLNIVYKDDLESIIDLDSRSSKKKAVIKSSKKLDNGTSNHVPRFMKPLTIKEKDINNPFKKNKQTKQKKDKNLESVNNSKLLISNNDLWKDDIWEVYDRIIRSYEIKDPKILQAFKSRSPLEMHNVCLDLLKSKLPEFRIKSLEKALTIKHKDSVWRGGLMILYSLYNSSIRDRSRYLGYLCNSKEIILIEQNIKALRIPIPRDDHNAIAKLLSDKFDLSNFFNKYYFFDYVVNLQNVIGSVYKTWLNDIVKLSGNVIYFGKKLAINYLNMKCNPSPFEIELKHITEEIP